MPVSIIYSRQLSHVLEQSFKAKAFLSPLIIITLSLFFATVVSGSISSRLSSEGYRDFEYGPIPMKHITGEKPESKLWWNDGVWWGSMLHKESDGSQHYYIYQLDWATHIWMRTNTKLDDRPNTKADVLWDAAAGKLYVASHISNSNGSHINSCGTDSATDRCGRLYRYSYDSPARTYQLDAGFPIHVNQDIAETLTIDKDASGRLWTAFVSRLPQSDPPDYQIFVNYSNTNSSGPSGLGTDANWPALPFSMDSVLPQDQKANAHVKQDDIAAVIAFQDNTGPKIGVVWSNQWNGKWIFAVHSANPSDPKQGWTIEQIPGIPSSDDHISLRALQTAESGVVFGVIKTSEIVSDQTLITLFARDSDGVFSVRDVSPVEYNDTRATLLIDQGDITRTDDDQIYVFVTGNPLGSKICYKKVPITFPLSAMANFPDGNCGESFIADDSLMINDSTSTKQNVTIDSGILVLASTYTCVPTGVDNCATYATSKYFKGWYVHNTLDTPLDIITHSPVERANNVDPSIVLTATFNKDLDPATINPTTFTLEFEATPVAGSVVFNPDTNMATFIPDAYLHQEGNYKATLSGNIKDLHGNPLLNGSHSWYFTSAQVLDPVPMLYLPVISVQ